MKLSKTLATLMLSSTLVGLSIGASQAGNVLIQGAAITFSPIPGYGNQSGNNNVVNSGTSGVTDLTNGNGSYLGTSGTTNSQVLSTVPLYNVDWYLIGAESGDTNRFTAPSVAVNEANQNNNCVGCGTQGPTPGPFLIGTSVNQTSALVNFSFTDTDRVGPGATAANGSNPAPNQPGLASMIFAYLSGSFPTWTIINPTTGANTDWFLAGFNDNGSPDDNHDDFMVAGHIVAVPIPAALGLFAGGLGLMGFLGRRRKRQASADLALA